ncbi:MAG: nuclear transport factor 2 family protein, partial [Balneolaceae bacterium]|nr:nuclear transport factor 2 family protein [Balneolaceae bacterium]
MMKERISNFSNSYVKSDLEASETEGKSFKRPARSNTVRRFSRQQSGRTLEGFLNSKFLILVLFFQIFSTVIVFAQTTKKSKLLQDYFDAYNQHEVKMIVDMVAEDFKMYSVMEDTMTVDIAGKENLQKWLTNYFQDLPNVSSEMSEISESGNYISFIETVHWGGNRSQSS